MDKLLNNTTAELGKLIHQLKELEKLPIMIPGVGKVSPSEFHLIEAIGKGQAVTGSDLVLALNMTKGAVSQFVKELLIKEIIQQQSDESDKRLKWLSLTSKGKRIYQEHQKLEGNVTRALVAELNQNELSGFVKGLEIFNNQLADRLTRSNEGKADEK